MKYHFETKVQTQDALHKELDRLGKACSITDGYEHSEHYQTKPENMSKVRTFETGATRDTDSGKLDFEAFLSPLALRRYAEYMHAHRKQSDGSMRDGDNWQKGIPIPQYVKSRFRHFFDTWALHRQGKDLDPQQEVNLCAEIFNAFGQLHEILKAKANKAAVFKTIADDINNDIRACINPLAGAPAPYDVDELLATGLPDSRPEPPKNFRVLLDSGHAPKAGWWFIGPERKLQAGDNYLMACPAYLIGTAMIGDEQNGDVRRIAFFEGSDEVRKDSIYGDDHPCR